jgi:hypothetical protein
MIEFTGVQTTEEDELNFTHQDEVLKGRFDCSDEIKH